MPINSILLANEAPFVDWSAGPADPLWDKVAFLLQSEYDTISDISSLQLPLTITGSLTTDSAVKQFGHPTIKFGASTSSAVTDARSELNFAAKDACIEGYYRFSSLATQNTLWRFKGASQGYNPYLMIWSDGTFYLRLANTGATIINAAHGMVTGQLYHIEVDKVGNTWYVFINGALKGTGTSSAMVSEDKAFMLSEPGITTIDHCYGIRVTIGAARHSAAFSPYTDAFPTHG